MAFLHQLVMVGASLIHLVCAGQRSASRWIHKEMENICMQTCDLTVCIQMCIIIILVGGLEHEFYDFPYIGNVIIPTDELIFFRGVGIPPTRLYIYMYTILVLHSESSSIVLHLRTPFKSARSHSCWRRSQVLFSPSSRHG